MKASKQNWFSRLFGAKPSKNTLTTGAELRASRSMHEQHGIVKLPFDETEQEVLNNCSGALGVPIKEVDVEFTDGTHLANVTVANGSMLIPSQYSEKPIEFIGVPLEQGAKVRAKGYAARSVRSNGNIILGTTLMMWMMKKDAEL